MYVNWIQYRFYAIISEMISTINTHQVYDIITIDSHLRLGYLCIFIKYENINRKKLVHHMLLLLMDTLTYILFHLYFVK